MIAEPLPYCPPVTPLVYTEVWRCCACHRIIARLWLMPGSRIEIKCRCNAMNILVIDIPAPDVYSRD